MSKLAVNIPFLSDSVSLAVFHIFSLSWCFLQADYKENMCRFLFIYLDQDLVNLLSLTFTSSGKFSHSDASFSFSLLLLEI